MLDHLKRLITLVACVSLLGLSGCFSSGDSNVANVTGIVTVDGEPIEYAIVSFMPVDGRASFGRTDANGVYTLAYVKQQKGALIGEHKVVIETKVVAETNYGGKTGGDQGGPPVRFTGRKEMLPKKYCDRWSTELTASVEKGDNNIDFQLTTKQ